MIHLNKPVMLGTKLIPYKYTFIFIFKILNQAFGRVPNVLTS